MSNIQIVETDRGKAVAKAVTELERAGKLFVVDQPEDAHCCAFDMWVRLHDAAALCCDVFATHKLSCFEHRYQGIYAALTPFIYYATTQVMDASAIDLHS
jgi:hypothetical protein